MARRKAREACGCEKVSDKDVRDKTRLPESKSRVLIANLPSFWGTPEESADTSTLPDGVAFLEKPWHPAVRALIAEPSPAPEPEQIVAPPTVPKATNAAVAEPEPEPTDSFYDTLRRILNEVRALIQTNSNWPEMKVANAKNSAKAVREFITASHELTSLCGARPKKTAGRQKKQATVDAAEAEVAA